MPTHANPLISDKSVPVTALGNQVAVQEICGCCSHSCLNNQPLRISTWRSDTPLQMAQPRSWVQTPAAHWSRQIPTTPQNPIMYVRTPVQHMTVPMVPMVRPSVVRPPGVRPPVAQPMHPPAPRWIYAAGLKQRSAQSTPGANAVPKVVAVNVGAPRAKKDNLWSRDVRLPRTGWKRCVGLEPFRAFWLVQFFPVSFSLYLGVLVACFWSGPGIFICTAKAPTKHRCDWPPRWGQGRWHNCRRPSNSGLGILKRFAAVVCGILGQTDGIDGWFFLSVQCPQGTHCSKSF